MRRLRRAEPLRALVRETRVDVNDLIYPLFVIEGNRIRQEVASMPGVFQLSVDTLPREVEEIARLGIPALLLFGIPEHKDEAGTEAYHSEGVVQRRYALSRRRCPNLSW